ncbi:MAG TPA: MFS transporter [Hyphomicrobiaceae bacterium]|nr:MFS transporter [Hyphomicrobiaceae bacterium]
MGSTQGEPDPSPVGGGAAAVRAPAATPAMPLRHPAFLFYWLARIFSVVAFAGQGVAVGWHLYALTGSALDLGLLGLVQFAPTVLLTLAVGHAADRYSRQRIAVLCQCVQGLASAALAAGTMMGWLDPAWIFILVAAGASARAFEWPSMAALLPSLVSREALPVATAWSTSANQLAQVGGPALGGLLYAVLPALAFVTPSALFLLSAAMTTQIAFRQPPRPPATAGLSSLFSGFAFVYSRRLLLGVLSLDLFAVLFGGAVALLPVYARDILLTGPWGLGLLRAAPAVGAFSMSMVLARFPLTGRVGPLLFSAVIAFGLATIIFGLSTWLPLSLGALFALGAADVVSVVIRFSLVQLQTPDDMRGRVSAVNALFIGTSNQLGDFESGVVAALAGAVASVVIGGCGTIAVALLWMWLFPELRRVQTLDG